MSQDVNVKLLEALQAAQPHVCVALCQPDWRDGMNDVRILAIHSGTCKMMTDAIAAATGKAAA